MAGENHYATASRRKILEILKESKDKTVTAAQIGEQLRQEWHQRRQSSHTYLFDHADEETAKLMEEIRLGKKKL